MRMWNLITKESLIFSFNPGSTPFQLRLGTTTVCDTVIR